MKENRCPECNGKTDAATSIEGDYKPSNGDISLCIHCGAINQFDSDLTIVPIEEGLLENIEETDPENYRMIMKAVHYIKNNVR